MDLSWVTNDSTHAAGGDDAYKATPDSNPWGVGGAPSGGATPVGVPANTEGGFYDQRDDMVGGSDTYYNVDSSAVQQSGANWYSAGDNSPVVNSGSGLGGERTAFSDVMSQSSLADGSNPDAAYGH